MQIYSPSLRDLVVIKPQVFGDQRGFFMEAWNRQRYQGLGLAGCDFVQDNFSFSRQGTLRGLHFQNPCAQGKLVSVIQGEVFDVVVDIRRSSPTFGHWYGLRLSEENRLQFYIPPGFAHGFAVLSETALFHYKCTAYYSPKDEASIRWDDPELGIAWPVQQPTLSARDAQAPALRDIPREKLFA